VVEEKVKLGTHTETTRYVWGEGLVAQLQNGQARYVHADGLGSVKALSDGRGVITDAYAYAAFGEVLGHAGTSEQPYRFAGEHYDPVAGMQYHRARWYDPATGRFTAIDPFSGNPRRPATLNKYAYANGDPINVSDPSGAFGIGSFAAGISIGITLASLAQTSIDIFKFATNPTVQGAKDIAIGFALSAMGAGGFKLLRMASPSFRSFLAKFGKLSCQSNCYSSLKGVELEDFVRGVFKGQEKVVTATIPTRSGTMTLKKKFDSVSDDLLIEVKSVDGFRDDKWLETTKQISEELKIANALSKPFAVASNGRIPEPWRSWLEEKGIKIIEFMD
jgi:RHS repeat-associated protein